MTRRLRSQETDASPLQTELPKPKPRGKNAKTANLYNSEPDSSQSNAERTMMRASEVATEHAQLVAAIKTELMKKGRSVDVDEEGCIGVAPSYLARLTNDRHPALPYLPVVYQTELFKIFEPQQDLIASTKKLLAISNVDSAFRLARARLGGLWRNKSAPQTPETDMLHFASEYMTDRTAFRQIIVDQRAQLEQNSVQMNRDSDRNNELERRVADGEDTVRQLTASAANSITGKTPNHCFLIDANDRQLHLANQPHWPSLRPTTQ